MSPVHIPDDNLIRRLPLPLARLYRKAANAEKPLERCLAAYYLWEAGLKLLASAALAEYACRKIVNADVAARLATLTRPFLGHWQEYVRILPPVLVAAGATEFEPIQEAFRRSHTDMPAAARLESTLERLLAGEDPNRAVAATPRTNVRLNRLFARLVEYRNHEIGHGIVGGREASDYEALSQVLLAGTAEIVGRVCLPAGFRLVYVSQVASSGPHNWEIMRSNLTGENPQRDPLFVPVGAEGLPMLAGAYLESRAPAEGGSQSGACVFRSLHPLALCDSTTKEILFLNAGLGEDDAEYLCYTDGRRARRSDLRADHHSFLSALLGRSVSASEVVRLVHRSRPEETPAARAPGAVAVPAPGTAALNILLPVLLDAISTPPFVSAEALRTAYHAVLPPTWEISPGGRTPADTLRAYCRDLARCPRRAGVSPLITFARTLASQCPEDFAEMLDEAIREAAQSIGEVPAATSRPTPPIIPHPMPPTPVPVASTEPSYLLIAIRAAVSEQGHYVVKGWLSTEQETICLEAGQERYTHEQLPAVVDRLHGLAETHSASLATLRVEFILPRELIPAAVDQWHVTVEEGLGTNAVGAEYPVLVRAADRYNGPKKTREKRLQALSDRWQWLAACTSTHVINTLPPPEAIPKFAVYPRESESERERQREPQGCWLWSNLKDDRTVLCAVLETPPSAEAAPQWDMLTTLLSLGMPVVAWSRGQPAAAQEIANLLHGSPLSELPDRIRRLRVQAIGADPEHAGKHVAILWDDPKREPPESGLQNQLRAT